MLTCAAPPNGPELRSPALFAGSRSAEAATSLINIRKDHGQIKPAGGPASRVGRRSCRRPRALCGGTPPGLERVVRRRPILNGRLSQRA
jgi:hypothetical protein